MIKLNTVQDCLDFMKSHPRTGFNACISIICGIHLIDYISLVDENHIPDPCFDQTFFNNSEIQELLGISISESIGTKFMIEVA